MSDNYFLSKTLTNKLECCTDFQDLFKQEKWKLVFLKHLSILPPNFWNNNCCIRHTVISLSTVNLCTPKLAGNSVMLPWLFLEPSALTCYWKKSQKGTRLNPLVTYNNYKEYICELHVRLYLEVTVFGLTSCSNCNPCWISLGKPSIRNPGQSVCCLIASLNSSMVIS